MVTRVPFCFLAAEYKIAQTRINIISLNGIFSDLGLTTLLRGKNCLLDTG